MSHYSSTFRPEYDQPDLPEGSGSSRDYNPEAFDDCNIDPLNLRAYDGHGPSQQAYPAPQREILPLQNFEQEPQDNHDRYLAKGFDDLEIRNSDGDRDSSELWFSTRSATSQSHQYPQEVDFSGQESAPGPNHQQSRWDSHTRDFQSPSHTHQRQYIAYTPQGTGLGLYEGGTVPPVSRPIVTSEQDRFSNEGTSHQPSNDSSNMGDYSARPEASDPPNVDQPAGDIATRQYYSKRSCANLFENGVDSEAVSEVSSDYMYSRSNSVRVGGSAYNAPVEEAPSQQALGQQQSTSHHALSSRFRKFAKRLSPKSRKKRDSDRR